MKHVKMLGLAVVAAMALTAFLGAGSASATVLCTVKTNPCPKASTVTELKSSLVGSAVLETLEGTVLDTCTGSNVSGKIESQGSGKPASGKISELTWTGCTRTTTTLAKGELVATQVGSNNEATIVGKGSEVTVNGIFNTSCVYGTGTGTTLGTLVGGHEPHLTIGAKVPRTASNFLCPAETRWTATYKVTNHTEVYVVDAGE